MNSFVLFGAGCLIALMPLALYFLFLAYLNQRGRPTMLSGPWDFGCLLIGLSGFMIIGGPVLLALVESAWRSYWFGGNFARLRDVWHAASVLTTAITLGYLLALGLLIVTLLSVRRKTTVVYNLEPGALESLVIAAAEACQFTWQREMGGIAIGVGRSKAAAAGDEFALAAPIARSGGRTAFVRIDSFPSFHHATLKWYDADPLLRSAVEAELDKLLQAIESPANPAGGWLMTGAVVLFFVMLAWMGFLIYTILFPQKGI